MHIQTHLMSGWCIGNCFSLSPRERFMCMLAASLPDLDGLGIIFGQDAYWEYHHLLGHNVVAGLLLSAVLACFSVARLKCFFIFLGLFHLHIAMDMFGSGACWKIYYLWPFSGAGIELPFCWDFYSWQNILAGVLFLVWTFLIIRMRRRTPLEYLMPDFDRRLADRIVSAMP